MDDRNRTVLVRDAGARAPTDADDRVHYLVVVEGEEKGLRIELGADPLVIGRAEPAAVVLPDALISRNHCRVVVVMDEVYVTDLGSSNGTFIQGERLSGTRPLPPGERVVLGGHILEHERRSRGEVKTLRGLDRDLEEAGRYVMALLPPPVAEGPVPVEWILVPSARLGGDAFGYRLLDPRTFAVYLLDVTGHGTGAAMHAVSVMNVLRQKSIAGIDLRDPSQVLAHLNERFPMEDHGEMLFTLWYGVVDLESREMAFASAGHHASYLQPAQGGEAMALDTGNVIIGAVPGFAFKSARVSVPPGSRLYIFSDGVFEIELPGGETGSLEAFVSLLGEPPAPGVPETRRLHDAMRARSARPVFDDDFTMVIATFP